MTLAAYCDKRSCRAGETVAVHVSCSARSFDVEVVREGIERLGVWSARNLSGREYAVPDDIVQNGARWPAALEIPTGEEWRSGFYLVRLIAADGATAEAFFVLRPAAPGAAILMVLCTNTWNAYNDFGGANTYSNGSSTYAGGSPRASFLRPFAPGFLSAPPSAARLATVGAPDRSVPYLEHALAHGLSIWSGAGSWLNWERPFVHWLEREGVQVDYAVNADLEEVPDLLRPYRLMLSVGHDEYWSAGMRDAAESFVAAGGNIAFFSGNTCFWQVRFEAGGDCMIAYKGDFRNDPLYGTPQQHLVTGLWSNPITGRPENELTGVSFTRGGYARIAGATPAGAGGYLVYRPDHWVFEGTDLAYGDLLGARSVIVGYECDGCLFTFEDGLPFATGQDGTPTGFEILGLAPAALWSRESAPAGLYPQEALSDLELVCDQLTGRRDAATQRRFAHGHSIMGIYTRGGTVFTAGTTDWACGLAGMDPQVERITHNVISELSSER